MSSTSAVTNRRRQARPPLEWTEADQRAVDLVRVLAMDAVQKAGSGHPGTAMSLAPAAYLLYQHVLRHDPADPNWLGRDRFVLSCGHSSLTLYIQLYLSGYGLSLDDLKRYREWGSLTPGHPEHGLTPGVETTTGPLGQGLANAVGMAMAARRERGLLDPDAPEGTSPFDHHVYVFVSDGDIEEGISHEASSLAAHQDLGNLVVLYDDNRISIEDNTQIAKSEDVAARYEAYGWHVQRLDWRGPTGYHEDPAGLYQALQAARARTDKPSLIALRTIIAWPAPHAQNTGAAHGAALGEDEVAATKEVLGFDPTVTFPAEEALVAHARKVGERGKRLHAEWDETFAAWARANPEQAALLDRLRARRLPEGWAKALPSFPPDRKGMATRKASGEVLNALAPVLPELWGGSADLAGSNNTTMKGEPSFIPAEHQTEMFPGNVYGRTLHFGIREHAMGVDPQRHRAGRPHPALRRHVPGLQRLHAAVRPAGRADGAAGDLRVDARLDRAGRGRARPTSRSSTWPRCGPSPGSMWSGRATRTRPAWPGGPCWSTPTGRPGCA